MIISNHRFIWQKKTIKSVKQTAHAHIHCSRAAYNTSPASVSVPPEKLARIRTPAAWRRDKSKTAHHNAATTYNIQPNSKCNGPATMTTSESVFTLRHKSSTTSTTHAHTKQANKGSTVCTRFLHGATIHFN